MNGRCSSCNIQFLNASLNIVALINAAGCARIVLLPQKYCPAAADLPTTNGPWATGDGVELGSGLGAALVGMEHVQVCDNCVRST
jgi:succinate dehydrogenase/fumarate reductase flavoprotein subunit